MEKTDNGEVLETQSTQTAETALPDDVLLQVNDLKKYFPVAKNFFGKPIKFLKAVDGISFTLKKGKTLGIVGESGCGKSTMGRSLLRLYDGVQGEILFDGQDVAKLKNREFDKLRPNMQMIFQDPYASLSPRLTVGEIIGESARQHHLVDKAGFHDYVLKVMDMCGLQPHYFERYPHEFSGGQRQRICIARALALQPKLVVCDEPVSALDVSIQAQVINMLIELREKLGLTYIFISHDLSVVKHISDDVGVMYLGNIVEYGSKDSVFSHTLHPYTKALFSAVPVPNPHVKMNRIMLKGDIPSPVNPPKGCKFHTRCEHCMEICSRIAPEYREVEDGHFCSCHLYNSEEDTLRLLAQADENERNEAIAAEKEANKPWNKAKAKVTTACKNVVTKIKNKFKKSEQTEQQPQEQPGQTEDSNVEEK
ncbi:MAG: dipeptide ABC transporter ATP-binding protein [Clostridia bacterium]|nr:dipeptide ABC transporter ATP-binding protein [Clostridia bacterium]